MRNFVEVKTRDARDAMVAAGHDFHAEMVPLRLPDGTLVPDKQAVVRGDTGAYLGTVGNGYAPVQPRRFYDLVGRLIETTGGEVDKCLSLRGGSVIGVSVSLGDTEYVPGDPVQRTFLAMTSFDSSYSVMGRTISNRWFCLNQLPSSRRVFSLKHTSQVDARLNTAMKMVGYLHHELEGFDARMKALAGREMHTFDALQWFTGLFPEPTPGRSATRLENLRDQFVALLHGGRGMGLRGVKGTAYGALQALTEWANHHRTTRVTEGRTEDEVRYESITFGSSDQIMQKAVESLLEWPTPAIAG